MSARTLIGAFAATFVLLGPSQADEQTDQKRCLNPDQRRAVVANRKAVPLTRAVRAVKTRLGGEVVRARLCDQGKGLVYLLTVLSRDGKVTLATVDAASGSLIGGG